MTGKLGVEIQSVSSFFPQDRISVRQFKEKNPDWDLEKIISKTGIETVYKSNTSETASDLAYEAIMKALADTDKGTIDGLIFVTQSPDYALPTSACILQDKIGLTKNTLAFDMNLGCSGFVYALATAGGMIESGLLKNCIIACADTYTKYIADDDRVSLPLFSDAGSAIILRASDSASIGPFIFGTDGSGAENLIVKGSASRPLTKGESNHLSMNGSQIMLFALDEIPRTVGRIIEKSNVSLEEIDLFVFHQASKILLESLTKKMKIDPKKVYQYLQHVGNTVSATIPLALENAAKEGLLKQGSKVILVGFGVGYSWGGCYLEWGQTC